MPGTQNSEHLTLVTRMDYLGVTLTYGTIEEITMQRRIGVAQGNFDRLRRILNNRRVLNSQQRLSLWQATVLPSLNYGILAVGINKLSLERYHGVIMRHIRSITNKPLHITKINNKELLQSLGMNAPVANLLRQVTTRRDNIAARWETQCDPMMHNESFWSQITGMREDLQAHLFRQNNRSANDSDEGRQRQRDASLGLFGLQSFGEKRSHGPAHSPNRSRSADETPQGHPRAHSWRNDLEVPRTATSGHGDGGRPIPHGPGDLAVKQGGITSTVRSSGSHEQQRLETHRSAPQPGPNSEITVGSARRRDDQGQVTQQYMMITLLNPLQQMLSKFTTHGSSVAQVYAWDYYAKLFGQHPVAYIKRCQD